MYVRRALQQYNALFEDLAAFTEGLRFEPLEGPGEAGRVAGRRRAGGPGAQAGDGGGEGEAPGLTLLSLLAQMRAFVERGSGGRAPSGGSGAGRHLTGA
jgi:hypothetical protein